jgi:uncharacterized protein YkwD
MGMRNSTLTAFLFVILVSCEKEKLIQEETPKVKKTYQEVFLELANALRKKGAICGSKTMLPVNALTRNAALEKTAELHAKDMYQKNYFSHQSPSGTGPGQRAQSQQYNYKFIGENIYMGYYASGDSAEAFEAWMNSPPHCENMMSPKFTEVGLAFENRYWVQVLGSR